MMETKFSDGQFMVAFNERQHEAYTIAKEHGFYERNIPDPEFIALIHSELSEALQALRNGNPPDHHIPEFSSLEIELADTVMVANPGNTIPNVIPNDVWIYTWLQLINA